MTLDPALTRISGLNHDFPLRSQQHVHARTELDQADAFARRHTVARLLVEDNAARDQAGNLFEDHGRAVALDGDDVLLVLGGTLLAAGHVETAAMVLHLADGARYRRAVHVHVENIQEDADAANVGALGLHRHHFAVGGRYRHRPGRNGPLGVAEEVETEERQHP